QYSYHVETNFQHKQKKLENKYKRQQRQLKFVRDRFFQQQLNRFKSQYVTYKQLSHERRDRHLYGLPEEYEPQNYTPLKLNAIKKKINVKFDVSNLNFKSKENKIKPVTESNKSHWNTVKRKLSVSNHVNNFVSINKKKNKKDNLTSIIQEVDNYKNLKEDTFDEIINKYGLLFDN
ncbi:hypothetical protein A3Q56_01781, partial [Intoshia linei]